MSARCGGGREPSPLFIYGGAAAAGGLKGYGPCAAVPLSAQDAEGAYHDGDASRPEAPGKAGETTATAGTPAGHEEALLNREMVVVWAMDVIEYAHNKPEAGFAEIDYGRYAFDSMM